MGNREGEMEEKSYRKLAKHLDQLPGGFAPSDTGAELRLLQRLFTPQEAELATHLTLNREGVQAIARRAGLPHAETEQRLAEMAHKGLIFSIHPEDGPILYQAVPFVIGIYEFQVNNLSEGLLQDLADYWSTRKQRPSPQTIPQMRTIPVGESIEPHLEALPYEQVNELVKTHNRFAVAPCICRREAKMTGGGCDAPEESCLIFGEWADYYVRDGRGRFIDRAELMDILTRADAANLVLQPTNSRDIAAICCCCGCCCGILGGLQSHPNPSEIVASSFIAKLEPEICQGCWVCVERCQMQALIEGSDRVNLNPDRCIGCGLCVSTCPSGALTLMRKPDSERTRPPNTLNATWRIIAQAQTEMY
jgi:electron transport complex protein RnfB